MQIIQSPTRRLQALGNLSLWILCFGSVFASCRNDEEKAKLRSAPQSATLETCAVVSGSDRNPSDQKLCEESPKRSYRSESINRDIDQEISQLEIEFGLRSLPTGINVPIRCRASGPEGMWFDCTRNANWRSVPPEILEIRTAADGSRTLIGLKPGKAIVTIAYGGKTSKVEIDVINAELASLMISPLDLARLVVGQSLELHASAIFADGLTIDITAAAIWASSNPKVLLINGSDNKVTAAGRIEGESTVTVNFGGKSTSVKARVADPPITSLAIQSDAISLVNAENSSDVFADLGPGMQIKLQCYATFQSGRVVRLDDGIIWESLSPDIASIDKAGNLTTIALGQTSIALSYKQKSANLQVRVHPALLKSLMLSPKEMTLPLNVSGPIRAFGFYEVANDNMKSFYMDVSRTAQWRAVDAPAVIFSSTEQETLVKATEPLKGKRIVIEASLGDKKVAGSFATIDEPIASLKIETTKDIVQVDEIHNLRAIGTYQLGQTFDLTKVATWTSSDPLSILVDNSVSPGTMLGVGVGGGKISANIGGQNAETMVGVHDKDSVITMSPASLNLIVGAAGQRIIPSFRPKATVNIPMHKGVWSSSNEGVATVDREGNVSAKSAGTARITFSAEGMSGSTDINATAADVSIQALTITHSSPNAVIPKGSSLQLSVNATTSSQTVQTITSGISWTTSNTAVATVSPSGMVTAIAMGAATITATKDGKSATLNIQASAPQVTSLTITPSTMSLKSGETQQLTVVASYSDNSAPSAAAAIVSFSSSNLTGATVANTGVVTAGLIGQTATITATLGGKSATATLSVKVPNAISLGASPIALAIGTSRQLNVNATYPDGVAAIPASQVNWSSGTPTAVSVSASGLVTAVSGSGSSVVTASLAGQSAAVTVNVDSSSPSPTVSPPTITDITISPPFPRIELLETLQLSAVVRWSDGTSSTVMQFSASGSSITPTGTAAGAFFAARPGTSTVTASHGNRSATVLVTVNAPALVSANPASSIEWNAADKQTNIVLSNGNLTAQTVLTSANDTVRATAAIPGSKSYFEVRLGSIDANAVAGSAIFVGVSTPAEGTESSVGNNGGCGYQNTGHFLQSGFSQSIGTPFAAGDTIGVATDLDTRTVRFSKNGSWLKETCSLNGVGPFFPAVTLSANAQFTANFGRSVYANDPPSGYVSIQSAAHTIFLSSTSYTAANFGGLAAMDTICKNLANAAGRTGNWKTIASDSASNAKDRLSINGKVARTDGAIIANNAADLWDGSISQGIEYDEFGLWVPYGFIIATGSNQDGTKAAGTWGNMHCNSWSLSNYFGALSSGSSSPQTLSINPYHWITSGTSVVNGIVTAAGGTSCGQTSSIIKLYCISQ